MNRIILVSFVSLIVTLCALADVTSDGKHIPSKSKEAGLLSSTGNDLTLLRIKRDYFSFPRMFRNIYLMVKNGVRNLKNSIKSRPRRPRRPKRRPPTRPGQPRPEEPEEPGVKPPLPYPGIPKRQPSRRYPHGPPRPIFKEAA